MKQYPVKVWVPPGAIFITLKRLESQTIEYRFVITGINQDIPAIFLRVTVPGDPHTMINEKISAGSSPTPLHGNAKYLGLSNLL